MADLFLSHSSSDVDAVRRLRHRMEAGGVSCWMAPDDVSSAGSWAQQIVEAVQGSRVTLVVLSARSVASEHVAREVGLAVQAGRPVLPVRIEPVALSGTLAYLLHLTQWVDAFPGSVDDHIAAIGTRVEELLRQPGLSPTAGPASPPPPPPAAAASPRPVPTPAVAPAVRTSGRSMALPGAVVTVGGIAITIATLLPWATADAGPITFSLNGIDREGVGLITGVLGLLLVGLGIVIARGSRVAGVVALVGALVAGAMGGAEIVRQGQLGIAGDGPRLAVGIGLWLLIGGAIVAGLAAAVSLVRGGR
jgi:hypothetical protein